MSSENRILGWGGREFAMIIVFFFGWGLSFLASLTTSYTAPMLMKEFDITNVQIGYLGTAAIGGFAVACLLAGGLSDKLGTRKKLLIPCLILCGVATALGAVTQDYTQLLISRIFVGIFQGPVLPLMMAMLAKESTSARFGLNAGIINAGVAILAILVGPSMMAQIATASNWRISTLVVGVSTIVIGLVTIGAVREDQSVASEGEAAEKVSVGESFSALFKNRNGILCFFIGIFGVCGYWSIMQFATLYWTNANLDLTTTGMIISGMGIGSLFYCIFVPKLSDVIGRKPTMIIAYIVCAIVPFTMAAFGGVPITIWTFVLFAGIPGAMTPMFMTLIPLESLPAKYAASAGGLILAAAQLVGGAIWPIILGMLADWTGGYTISFALAAIWFVIAIGLSLGLKETHPRAKKKVTAS